jgi:hypothetical protein
MSKIIKTITIYVHEDWLKGVLQDEELKVNEDNMDILTEMVCENLEEVLLERAEEYTRYLAIENCEDESEEEEEEYED